MAAIGGWTQSAAAQNQQGRVATKAEYNGWRQYMTNCARCHGDDAVGGVMAPDLRKSVAADTANQATFHSTVSEGRLDKGMPSFKSSLNKEHIDAIYAYLRARAAGELPAGRPRQQ
ncbi:MAG: c-type cytochrome [Gemmatimonadaceae bacterium]|nr:c-type cytochrome [Gemmatimonadaceae bacterium]